MNMIIALRFCQFFSIRGFCVDGDAKEHSNVNWQNDVNDVLSLRIFNNGNVLQIIVEDIRNAQQLASVTSLANFAEKNFDIVDGGQGKGEVMRSNG